MSKPIRILVTAVGGDLGQALVKALRLSNKHMEIYGCDMDAGGSGSAFVDWFSVVPRASDTSYIKVLGTLCQTLSIDCVIPGSEVEIYVLSKLSSFPKLPGGTPVICQEAKFIETLGDKLNCMRSLDGKVELVPFADGTDHESVEKLVKQSGFPLVVKERRSSGSLSLRIARDLQMLTAFLAESKAPLVQAFVDDMHGEFTIGIFSSGSFMQAIAFKRKLKSFGPSWYAESSHDKEVLEYAMKIAKEVNTKGSINIQVRKSSRGVRLLEINPRFSSLAAARAACGFRDVEWSVGLAMGGPLPESPQSLRDLRFCRFFGELVDTGEGFRRIPAWDPLKSEKSQG